MPGQLLPIRLINSSVSARGFSSMRHAANFQCSRGVSNFRQVFPFRLKYLAFSRKLGFPVWVNKESGVRRFSSRSFLSRNGGGGSDSRSSRNLEFERSRGMERGEFQAGGFGGRGGQTKSLVEDEAELSDWIDELRKDPIRLGLSSESDDSDMGSSKGRGRDEFSSMKNRRVGTSRSKRWRDSDSDDFAVSQGSKSRGTKGSFSRDSRFSLSESKRRFRSESEEDGDEDFSPRRRDIGSRGAAVPVKSGGRNSNLSYGGRNLQRGGKGSRRQPPLISEDDEDEDLPSNFGDLLSEEGSEESDDNDEFEDANLLPGSAKEANVQTMPKSSTAKTDSYLSQTRFDQCSLSPLSLKGIKDAGYERMTMVQEETLPIILKGKDVLAKARTGTGKTVAFLLPAIEVIVKSPPIDRDQKRPPISVLVICPTRELATQAAAEANTLLKYHPSIGVQVVIGGTRLALEQKRMQANPCQILVATPGRLRDHIENTAGFATRLMGVKVLVLDEADHLLDMGFRKDIEKIIAAVPKQRQTLLFSATIPEEVRQISHIALRRDHEFVNTVAEGSEETHSQVIQKHLVAPLDKHFSLLFVLLKEHISDNVDYKVLVFCTTAMVTRLVADLLSELNLNVREIHSRKPQSYRTRVSDEFRRSKGLILVTSDVSARGVDYPDVTLVIQVGLPSDREQYIHRLGRTGRKGKEGQGVLLLAPWEEFFLSSVKDLPIEKISMPSVDPDTKKKVERALSHVEMKNKAAAYQAWLGFYNSNKIVGRDKCRLVELANEFSRSMGLDNSPAIPKLVLGKMGLRNVPGLRSK
ncbi:PREDICTED: DEAD-box ATP-dependent RNA helicase 31-like [Nelumbo nucifera]|uniref:ATP-dependent RNA helicase n=2 Tax=Nelumbo nucifera TaxID=4432 RepID=A0A1U8AKI3_NELNU|nr:PREDICTED: DEAD-box ATP-dependent RNA helicase 31-like [Nelumbo nucifera]DAD36292.1 TPA_asm: hypothetical protein HUJ06_006932 [Nelumbo nucifera]